MLKMLPTSQHLGLRANHCNQGLSNDGGVTSQLPLRPREQPIPSILVMAGMKVGASLKRSIIGSGGPFHGHCHFAGKEREVTPRKF